MTEETLSAKEQALLELACGRLNNPSHRNAALVCSKGPVFLEDRPGLPGLRAFRFNQLREMRDPMRRTLTNAQLA